MAAAGGDADADPAGDGCAVGSRSTLPAGGLRFDFVRLSPRIIFSGFLSMASFWLGWRGSRDWMECFASTLLVHWSTL